MAELKILTIMGTRPEFIRLSLMIPKLDKFCKQAIIHTGQNYDSKLSNIFFGELKIRKPNYYLDAQGTFAEQAGIIFKGVEDIIKKEAPHKFMVLGDTNSSLGAIVAKRMGIPVYHLEAGNRCYDNEVPEEVNRRLIDHCSNIHMPYTENSRRNLIKEGIPPNNIYVVGNPIFEVMVTNLDRIEKSTILRNISVKKKKYFLVTIHRSENVDNPKRLSALMETLNSVFWKYNLPIIVSTHPHTRKRLESYHAIDGIKFLEPFGFFDFVKLEQNALCILSDSGTVSEEASILNTPCVILRNTTERMETIECGANILAGVNVENTINAVDVAIKLSSGWNPPIEYRKYNVSDTVVKIMMGYYNGQKNK